VTNHYVDYNPDLPPAAFPTLDEPLPKRNSKTKERNDKVEKVADAQMSNTPRQSLCVPAQYETAETEDDLVDIPIGDIENYISSNGPQNPRYASNMARIARLNATSSSTSEDMKESSDNDMDCHPLRDSTDVCTVYFPSDRSMGAHIMLTGCFLGTTASRSPTVRPCMEGSIPEVAS
jgi:hypothetical protein